MCQSINKYENNVFENNENDTIEINSSRYQYIDSQEEGEEYDIFDFNVDFIKTLSQHSFNILYELIESLNEDYEFNDDIDDFKHEQIDNIITGYTNKFCEGVLYEYGIIKGIKEYTDEFGELCLEEDSWIKQVLYIILKNNMICRIEEVDDENKDINKINSYITKTDLNNR
jgi:hypothetical protein